jgi:hypothetical protein
MFCPRKKLISRTFKIRGKLIFLCPIERKRERERECESEKGKGKGKER